MVDLMNLLSDVLIGSFQMLMLNDLGKNMFPYRIKTCYFGSTFNGWWTTLEWPKKASNIVE